MHVYRAGVGEKKSITVTGTHTIRSTINEGKSTHTHPAAGKGRYIWGFSGRISLFHGSWAQEHQIRWMMHEFVCVLIYWQLAALDWWTDFTDGNFVMRLQGTSSQASHQWRSIVRCFSVAVGALSWTAGMGKGRMRSLWSLMGTPCVLKYPLRLVHDLWWVHHVY